MDEPQATAPWIGHLDLHLLNRQEETAALLGFDLRPDVVRIEWRETRLASIDRADLRAWLLYREEPLEVGDVMFSVEGSRVALTLFQRQSYLLPEIFCFELVGVI